MPCVQKDQFVSIYILTKKLLYKTGTSMLGGSLIFHLEIIKSQFQDFLSLMISQEYNFLSSMIILNDHTGWIVSAHVL